MKELIIASHNKNKIDEIRAMLSSKIALRSLKDIGFDKDIEETAKSLEGNADIKANHIYNMYKTSVFADDSGLEVDALNGAPGVHSARYAGEAKNNEQNIQKLLDQLKAYENRKAQFRTVISLIWDNKLTHFEGIVRGSIVFTKKGKGGFGYDPLFVPEGYHNTFAELPSSLKNKISHRGLAVTKMIRFLNSVH